MDTRENQQDKGSQKLDPLKNVNLPDGESIEEVDDAAMLNDLLRDLSPDLLVTDEEKTAGEPAAVDAPSDVVSAETLVTDEKEAEVSPEVVEAAPVMAPEPEPVSEPEEVVSVPPVETVEKDSLADLEPPEDLQIPSESAVSGGWDVADEPAELELAMDQAFGLDAAEPLSPTLSSTETPAPLVDEPVEESAVDLEPAAPAVPSLGGSSSSGDELDGVFDAFEMAEEDVESAPVAEAESAPESSPVDEVLDGVFGTSSESEVPTESVDVEQSALDTELDALFGETSEPEGVAAEEPAKQTSDDETMLTPLDHIEPEPAEGLPEEPVSEPEQKIVEQKTGGVGLFDEMSLDESLGEALGLGPGDGVKETKQEPVAEAIPAEEIVPQTIFADVSESEKPVDGAVGPPDSGLLDLVTGLVVERMVTRIEQDQTYDESATPAPVAPVAEPPVDIPLETPVEADATTDELDEPPAEAGFLDATIEDEFVVAEEEPVTDQATTPEIVRPVTTDEDIIASVVEPVGEPEAEESLDIADLLTMDFDDRDEPGAGETTREPETGADQPIESETETVATTPDSDSESSEEDDEADVYIREVKAAGRRKRNISLAVLAVILAVVSWLAVGTMFQSSPEPAPSIAPPAAEAPAASETPPTDVTPGTVPTSEEPSPAAAAVVSEPEDKAPAPVVAPAVEPVMTPTPAVTPRVEIETVPAGLENTVGRYTVLVESFRTEARAQIAGRKWKARGYSTVSWDFYHEKNGLTYVRLGIGRFKTRTAARKATEYLRARYPDRKSAWMPTMRVPEGAF